MILNGSYSVTSARLSGGRFTATQLTIRIEYQTRAVPFVGKDEAMLSQPLQICTRKKLELLQHDAAGALCVAARKRAGSSPHPLPGSPAFNQVQTIWPPADDVQVLVVRLCEAAAVQLAGGPATAVAVTVTFCETRKP